jgi:hypothetical protein
MNYQMQCAGCKCFLTLCVYEDLVGLEHFEKYKPRHDTQHNYIQYNDSQHKVIILTFSINDIVHK